MAGKQKGAAKRFQEKTNNPKATYIHCSSHELYLALSRASKVPEVYNMICLMQSLGVFFKFSPKRQRKLEKVISKTAVKDAVRLKTRVKPVCETKSVERHT